ncbi:MAG: hypothetical protein ABMA64_14140 [Myxococcota bacterium]
MIDRSFALLLPLVALTACNPDPEPEPGDPCEQSGNICTWLGKPGVAGVSGEGLDRRKTWLYLPVDISFRADGTAVYPDYNNHRVRMIDPDGLVHTVSGTGMLGDGPNTIGSVTNCWEGCDSLKSAWNHPTEAIFNPADDTQVWVAAWHNSRVNVIDTLANQMTWFAGTGGRSYGATDVDADGNFLDDAIMDLPSSLAFADDGTLYFADQANHLIRRINPDGSIEVVAGEPRHAGFDGDGGPASEAHLHGHTDQKADPGSKMALDGNLLYFTDTVNGVIRVIDLDTMTVDHVAGKYESLGLTTYVDAVTGVSYEADAGSVTGYVDGPAEQAVLNTPRDIAVGIDGEIYVAEPKNNCVRVVGTDGVVSTFAGQCTGEPGFDGDGGPAADSVLNDPFGVSVDFEGNVYISDTNNHVIRRVKH